MAYPMLDVLRYKVLMVWSRLVSQRPGWVLFVALAAAIASVAVTMGQLRFQSNRNDLISDELDWNRRFLEWIERFPGTSDLYVVVDTYDRSGQPSASVAERARALVDELTRELPKTGLVRQAVGSFGIEEVHPKAFRLEPMAAFRERLEQFREAEALLASQTLAGLLERAGSMAGEARGAAAGGDERSTSESQEADSGGTVGDPADMAAQIEMFGVLIGAIGQRLRTPADELIDLSARMLAAEGVTQRQYLSSDNGRLLFVRIEPAVDEAALSPMEASVDAIRNVLDRLRSQYPQVDFGLTGIEVIEADETRAATRDSMITSIAAATLIAILLVTAFHSVRLPLLMLTSLGVGIAWSFGFLTLTIGHLQVISVVFTVILLGLGVAFGIHLSSRFERVRHRYPDDREGFAQALRDTFAAVGPGVVTGGLTTAAAFCTTMLTDFRGVAEMGAIAAAGIVLCLIAMFTVLPALLALFKPHHRHVTRMEGRAVHLFEERWVMPFVNHPRATLVVAGLVFAGSLLAVSQMRYDYNLLALLPRGVDSVEWQQRIVEEGEMSVYHGVSIVQSLAEGRRRAETFRALPTVEAVEGIGRLFPPNEAERIAMIERTRTELEPVLNEALAPDDADAAALADGAAGAGPSGQELLNRLASLGFVLNAAAPIAPAELRPSLTALSQSIREVQAAAASLDPDTRARRLDALQRDYTAWRLETARFIDRALDPSPITPDDLPRRVLAPYISRDSESARYALEVHPRLPEGVRDPLHPTFLSRFIEDLRSVDPNITGVIAQIYYSGTLIWRSYLTAGVYALVVVLIVVWLDFRSLHDAALTLVPVAIGFAATFGIMFLLGQRINPANIIVLPLMFGIGVDAGVHLIHRVRQNPSTRPLGLAEGTGKGITLTSFTTMIGFGALIFASHRGVASLGFVLTVGIGMTLLACLTVMPAWLELRARRATDGSGGPSGPRRLPRHDPASRG